MSLTVLMDNNTYIDRYYLGEPAVAYYIEDGEKKILFDTAYSGAFLNNADAMGIDLKNITDVVLSHGHNDHTGGIPFLLNLSFIQRPILTAHPDVFIKRTDSGTDIGCPSDISKIKEAMELRLSDKPVKISDNITYLGEIPEVYEKRRSIGTAYRDGSAENDFMMDDSALVYDTDRGIYIITGCSHSGICNVIQYAKKVTGKSRLLGIIGGLHLLKDTTESRKTVDFLKAENMESVYPCHCTSFKVRSLMDRNMDVKDVGVGLVLEW